ncbi:MAG: LEA type 2 family protein, partial [Pseudomonadota bacterium]|nr:LEA type 2 family protein [Pseudomonadota bacterium]
MTHTRLSLGLIVLFSLMLSGCQSIISQFSQPEIQSVRIYPNINTLTTGELTVELDVFNPNFIGIDPETLDLALAVNGKSILSASSTDLPNLPANGSATIKTDVRLGWNEIQE